MADRLGVYQYLEPGLEAETDELQRSRQNTTHQKKPKRRTKKRERRREERSSQQKRIRDTGLAVGGLARGPEDTGEQWHSQRRKKIKASCGGAERRRGGGYFTNLKQIRIPSRLRKPKARKKSTACGARVRGQKGGCWRFVKSRKGATGWTALGQGIFHGERYGGRA